MNKKYVIFLIIFSIAAAIAAFSYFELYNSKNSLEKVIQNESNNLTYSLKFAIENNLKSNSLIEEKVKDNIVSSSTLLAHTFKHQSINTDFLKKFSKDYNLDLIIIISPEIVLSNIDNIKLSNFDDYLTSEIEFIKTENYFWLDIGNQMFNNVEYVSIAGHFGTDNVIIISGIQSSSLLDMRRSVGIGKLINDFNRNNQLLYTCLQDTFGIIAASKNISELSTIKSDTFLQKSYSKTNPNSRYYLYQKVTALENVIKIENDDDDFLLRIGLNLEYINQINQTNSIRTIFLSLGLFIISVVIVILVNQRNKHRKLKDEHQKVIEYTNALMNNINDAVIAIDVNMWISIINLKAIKLFHIDFNHLKSYSDIFNNDELILKDSILNNKGIDYLELKYKENVLAMSISIINSDKAESKIALAVIRDITEIKKLEEIKSRTERMEAVNVLASSVAHEIRNPMNAVNLIAQRLEIEFEPKSDYDEYFNLIKTVRSEIKRINNIITQFLEFGRIKKSEIRLNDFSALTEFIFNLFQLEFKQRSIDFTYNFDKNLYFYFDYDKIKQVMINLIQNSIDAIGSDGKIEIEYFKINDVHQIKIKDSGKGISEEIRNKIFNLYFTTKSNGNGLGLAIVYKIILEHSGKIYFESFAGKGTTFVIELPEKSNE